MAVGAYLTNWIDDGVTITASSEDDSYPVGNLYDKIAANPFRAESKTSLTLLLDFGASVALDTLAILNHNFSSSVSLSLKAGNVNPPTSVVAYPAYREYDLWKLFTQTTARYWLLTITDSNSDYLEIGELVIGQRVNLPRQRRVGNGFMPAKKRNTIGDETYGGVAYRYYLYDRNELRPVFRIVGATELAVFSGLDREVYGDMYPFVYIPDTLREECYYVRKEQSFEPREYDEQSGTDLIYDYTLMMTEESRGLDIQE